MTPNFRHRRMRASLDEKLARRPTPVPLARLRGPVTHWSPQCEPQLRPGAEDVSAVQIDYVVVLAAVWRTGASRWKPNLRLFYANDPLVLLRVDGPTTGPRQVETLRSGYHRIRAAAAAMSRSRSRSRRSTNSGSRSPSGSRRATCSQLADSGSIVRDDPLTSGVTRGRLVADFGELRSGRSPDERRAAAYCADCHHANVAHGRALH